MALDPVTLPRRIDSPEAFFWFLDHVSSMNFMVIAEGVGTASRAAMVAASAAVFSGIAEQDLRQYYGRSSQRMENDNRAGKLIFGVVDIIKPWRFIARALLRMIASEQPKAAPQRRMSNIIWDMFTGSAPYRDILYRMLHPAFWSRFIWYIGSERGRH